MDKLPQGLLTPKWYEYSATDKYLILAMKNSGGSSKQKPSL
jgi:hypothetical protein